MRLASVWSRSVTSVVPSIWVWPEGLGSVARGGQVVPVLGNSPSSSKREDVEGYLFPGA